MSEELELKQRFAALLLKNPSDGFKIALELFPDDTSKALKAAIAWPKDLEVLNFQEKLIDDGDELDFHPTKGDLARKIWDKLEACRVDEDFVKLSKLYAEVRGFIDKPQTNIQVNNNTDNRVMIIKDLGTDQQWEKSAAEQQRKLLHVSTSKH